MKLAALFLVFLTSVTFAGKPSTKAAKATVLPTHKITVRFQEAKVKEVLSAVLDESGYRFKFDKNIPDTQKVNLKETDKPWNEVFSKLMKTAHLKYTIDSQNTILIKAVK